MGPAPDLVDAIGRELPATAGVVLGIGDPGVLSRLQERLPGMLVLLDPAAVSHRRGPRPDSSRAVLADPAAPPLAPESLDGMIAVSALSRSSSPAALLRIWARHLRPGGWLLVAEPLIRSASLRRLQGLLGRPLFARPPEEITGLLLNAGVADIAQSQAGPRRPSFITWGRLLELSRDRLSVIELLRGLGDHPSASWCWMTAKRLTGPRPAASSTEEDWARPS